MDVTAPPPVHVYADCTRSRWGRSEGLYVRVRRMRLRPVTIADSCPANITPGAATTDRSIIIDYSSRKVIGRRIEKVDSFRPETRN